MLSHIYLGVADFGRALAFYAPIMAALGLKQRFADPVKGWAAWNPSTGGRPLFIIGKPYNGAEHDAGNGQMVAFMANTRAVVEQAHALALAHGPAKTKDNLACVRTITPTTTAPTSGTLTETRSAWCATTPRAVLPSSLDFGRDPGLTGPSLLSTVGETRHGNQRRRGTPDLRAS